MDGTAVPLKENNIQKFLITAVTALLINGAFAAPPQSVTLDVKNMDCGLCPITVKKSLERVGGVTEAKVDFAQKSATVTYDPDKATTTALVKATSDAGFPSALRK